MREFKNVLNSHDMSLLLGKSPHYGMAQYHHTILWAQTNERNHHSWPYLQVKDFKLNSIAFGGKIH